MTKIKSAKEKPKPKPQKVTKQNDLGGGLFCVTISGDHQTVVDDDQIGGTKEYHIIKRKEWWKIMTLVMDKVQIIKGWQIQLTKERYNTNGQ